MKDRVSGIRRKSRFVAEIRYPVVPRIFDSRGELIESIHSQIKDRFEHWRAGIGTVTFSDKPANEKPIKQFIVSLKRSAVILEDCGTVEEFNNSTRKYFNLMLDVLGTSIKRLNRCGVRFLEIIEPEGSPSFDDIFERIKSRYLNIPEELSIDLKDLQIRLVHKKGFYAIGTVQKGEEWINQTFTELDHHIPEAGVGLDIDSYETDLGIKKNEDVIQAFNAVSRLTKAIEENLLSNLGMISD